MPRKNDPDTGKRWPLSLRTTKELREGLERAAAKSGRSLAQEVEHRLEASLELEQRNYPYVGYKTCSSPLIFHKGTILLVVDGGTTVEFSIEPAGMDMLMERIRAIDTGDQ
jgi:hypothetical protein